MYERPRRGLVLQHGGVEHTCLKQSRHQASPDIVYRTKDKIKVSVPFSLSFVNGCQRLVNPIAITKMRIMNRIDSTSSAIFQKLYGLSP